MGFSSGLPWICSTSLWKLRGSSRSLAAAERVAQRRDELLEDLDLGRIRRLVHAIERRHVPRVEVGRHRLVGEQHELFDQPVRDVALRSRRSPRPGPRHPARSPIPAGRSRWTRGAGAARSGSRRARACARTSARAAGSARSPRDRGPSGSRSPPCRSCAPGCGSRRRAFRSARPAPERLSTSIRHDCTSRSTCGFRLQSPVASSAGNMCTARSGKVDRRRPLVGLGVERAALGHVVRHVGDVHAEPEVAVRQPVDRNRVVEIARVLAVDGDGGPRTEVRAALEIALADRPAQPLGLARPPPRDACPRGCTCG